MFIKTGKIIKEKRKREKTIKKTMSEGKYVGKKKKLYNETSIKVQLGLFGYVHGKLNRIVAD